MVPSETLKKHAAFWQPRSAGRALLARLDHPVWRPRPYPLAGGRSQEEPAAITASDLDVDRLLGLDRALPAPFRDDLAQSVRTVYPVAWMESLIGCPIYASAYSCSSRPPVRGETALSAFLVTRALDSPWLGAMDAVLDREVSAAAGALPAAQLHLRGVSDMLAAYLGEERLCTALYDAPAELAALAESFARLYLRVAERDVTRRKCTRFAERTSAPWLMAIAAIATSKSSMGSPPCSRAALIWPNRTEASGVQGRTPTAPRSRSRSASRARRFLDAGSRRWIPYSISATTGGTVETAPGRRARKNSTMESSFRIAAENAVVSRTLVTGPPPRG